MNGDAEVFVARDRDNRNTVVIKALNTHLQGSPPPELEQMLTDKFETEAAILKRIRHSNIVSILDQGEVEDRRKNFTCKSSGEARLEPLLC